MTKTMTVLDEHSDEHSDETDEAVVDLLVEEVSIDGLCGVY